MLDLKLDKQVEPLPVDSTLIVRPRSALGLKYVELTPGPSKAGFEAGATIPLKQATPEPVEIDEFFNTFDDGHAARRAAVPRRLRHRRSPAAAATSTRRSRSSTRCSSDLEPVAAQPGRPAHAARPRFFRALAPRPPRWRRWPRSRPRCSATSTPPSPRSRASRGRSSRTSSPRARPRSTPAIRGVPAAAPVPAQQRGASSASCGPGVAALPAAAPVAGRRVRDRHRARCPGRPALNRQLVSVFDALDELRRGPARAARHRAPARHGHVAAPTVAFLTPAQTVCNYVDAVLPQRRRASCREGDANGT